jgi:flagellar hook-length control protein FliK
MGGSMVAKPSFQARSTDSAAGPATDDQSLDADPGANSTTGATGQAATGDSGATGSSDGIAAGSGKTGPSAQTRNAQASQSQATARSRSRATGSASSQPATTNTQDATDDASTDFGSVMANALGRSAAAATDPASPTKTPASSGDSASTANAAAPTAVPTAAPADAVAWIAQMMTPGAAQTAATPANPGAATTGAAQTGLSAALGATAGGSADARTVETIAADNAAAAGQSPANSAGANRTRLNADPLPQIASENTGQTVQTGDALAAASAAATGPANLNALADVQKLISGLTATDSDSDADGGAVTGTPTTHAATDGAGSTAAAQAAAALQSSSLTGAGAGLGTTTLSIQSPVGSAAFADEVTSRVTSLAQSGITQAQLQLNPTDLGPVQVHITMQSGQASVWFGATHSDTRAALEHSLPRLREMFASAGLPLSDSGVFREPPQPQAHSLPAAGTSRTTSSETAANASVTQVANVRLSLLDIYA